MADGAPPAVRLVDVRYRYEDGTTALCDLGFEIAPGEAVGLVGPNGAGKSTLALVLAGFLRPAAGRVEVFGVPVERRTLVEVRRRLGLVFQDPDDQLFLGTLLDDVAFGPLNQGLDDAAARARATETLARVGLERLSARFPGHLSAGEKRAAAIAAALAMRPEMLVLDEPTANLDPRSRRRVIEIIRGLPGTRLVISHDLEMILDCCARVLLFDAGRLVADGPAVRLLSDGPLLAAHALEKPHSLMGADEHAHVHEGRHGAAADRAAGKGGER